MSDGVPEREREYQRSGEEGTARSPAKVADPEKKRGSSKVALSDGVPERECVPAEWRTGTARSPAEVAPPSQIERKRRQ